MYHIKIPALLANKEFEADKFREKKNPSLFRFVVLKLKFKKKSFLKNNEV